MKMPLAVVADHASVDASQKLTAVGIFDRIQAPSFPVMHPSMALALRFTAETEDSERKASIRIRLMDEDGRLMIEGNAEVGWPTIAAGDFAAIPLVIQIGGLPLPRAGRYHFEVSGEELEGSPIQVPFIAVLQQPQ